MRILLIYDNFVRDYRGLLLLKEFLKRMGHRTWIYPGWKNPIEFALYKQAQIMVVGQIAESATSKYGAFCKKNSIHLVINTSEPISAEKKLPIRLAYNTNDSNQDIISLQTLATKNSHTYVKENKNINALNKNKYKLVGFPRTDISYQKELRTIEEERFSSKYNLGRFNKTFLFVSSFLFEDAFVGVPEKDLEKWDYSSFRKKTSALRDHTVKILKKFILEELNDDEVLLIKKHPWDCSDFWENFTASQNCIVLDNTEFITTCINASDIIIHTYSTSAIEAWIMNKKTVSIFLEEYSKDNIIHMQFENIAYDYETFLEIINDSSPNIPDVNNDILFNGTMDGQATLRLAQIINELKPLESLIPKRPPSYSRLIKLQLDYLSKNWGLRKYYLDTFPNRNSKLYDFMAWENQKSIVNRTYRKPIRKFVKATLKAKKQ
ncbi:MAG: hypothetical protein H6563_03075 [Lewinellaceae bacterium]|nr:hypothetical protein [Lewinellaceae bacterium]